MMNQSIIDKLIEMRLTSMADALRIQITDHAMTELAFEDKFSIIVDAEYNSMKLNRTLIQRLATSEYISECRNIFITGATGSGKTYMACAFGMEACKQYYKTRYVRLPDLLINLQIARNERTYLKAIIKYANPVLLIIDEWLLLKPSPEEQKDIFELLHLRRKKSSAIFCSQYRHTDWYDQLGGTDSPLADAILDRIVHDAYRIDIESMNPTKDISMREVYGLDKSLVEKLVGFRIPECWFPTFWNCGFCGQEYSFWLHYEPLV